MIPQKPWNYLLNFPYDSWGIPNGCRARPILFLKNSLQPKTNAYPAIGQKKLNGAASRMMVNFFAELSHEIQRLHPSDVHRCFKIGCDSFFWGIWNPNGWFFFLCLSHKVDCLMLHGICADQCYLCKQPPWTTSHSWPGSYGICIHDLPQGLQQNLSSVSAIFFRSPRNLHFIWH